MDNQFTTPNMKIDIQSNWKSWIRPSSHMSTQPFFYARVQTLLHSLSRQLNIREKLNAVLYFHTNRIQIIFNLSLGYPYNRPSIVRVNQENVKMTCISNRF